MRFADVIGALAVAVSTLSLAPQLYKTWRIKHADDLSYGWLLMALVGAVLWTSYGAMNADWALIAANSLIGALLAALLAMKRYYAKA